MGEKRPRHYSVGNGCGTVRHATGSGKLTGKPVYGQEGNQILILTRHIGNDIKITVTAINGNQVRIGIDAPKEVKVLREELVGRDKEASGNVL